MENAVTFLCLLLIETKKKAIDFVLSLILSNAQRLCK